MVTNTFLLAHRADILRIAQERGARNVRVFGSMARGDNQPESDLDLLVDLEPGRNLLDLGGLVMDLEELLGVRVDIATEKGLRERLRERILHEAAAL